MHKLSMYACVYYARLKFIFELNMALFSTSEMSYRSLVASHLAKCVLLTHNTIIKTLLKSLEKQIFVLTYTH